MAKKKRKEEMQIEKGQYYPAEEQWASEETPEKEMLEMEEGLKEEDVYTEEGREKLKEDAEIETWEEGFMEGAEAGGQLAKCLKCGKPFIARKEVVERKIDDEILRFCSEECAEKYIEEHG